MQLKRLHPFFILGQKYIKSRLKLSRVYSSTASENLWSETTFVFYCCITCYHKLSSSKSPHLLSHHFWEAGIQGCCVLCTPGRDTLPGCALRLQSQPRLRRHSQITRAVGRIQLLAVTLLSSPFLCWLSTGGGSQFPGDTSGPPHLALSQRQLTFSKPAGACLPGWLPLSVI